MDQLIEAGGKSIIFDAVESGKPVIGICVGMQILFGSGLEKGEHQGLGLFEGSVSHIESPILPHMGWNTVESAANSRLFKGIQNESFYFVHSFAAKQPVSDAMNSYSNYGEKFLAAVERENVSAVQFHPEKSGSAGATLIANWAGGL
jgi:glutamine amidotransferase